LPCGVPNLQLDYTIVALNSLKFEVDANCVEKVLVELVLCVSEQQAGLAHSTVTNQQHLKQVVVVLIYGGHFDLD
jgi:hypothetical protein